MTPFRKVNLITGWMVFLLATVTYLLTIEPTTSFWDCGEFIAASYKLQIGHPPGTPLFLLLGRFFSLFAMGNVEYVAAAINVMSALSGGFTVLFLFWTITHIAKRFMLEEGTFPTDKLIAIMGTGIVGALGYAWSDTQWFSAVEGEVYSMSSMFTAFVFWAILKWENIANEKHSGRWLILITYVMGLSIGVHLLNLLTIPAIVLVYYFKKYEITTKGIISALGISVLLLGGIMYGIIQGIPILASRFELLFVNTFGLPYWSGAFFFTALLIGGIVYGLYYSVKHEKHLLNTILLGTTVVLIGYSSFALTIIRAQANPPMNQNKPDNMFSLLPYLQREQYGDRPLMKGQYFNAPVTEWEDGKAYYAPIGGKYKIIDHKPIRTFDSKYTTLFPRMYSDGMGSHAMGYKMWAGIPQNVDPKKKPSFAQNLTYFFRYQINHMYFRYFMWNFAGRQSDIQNSDGNIIDGNWLSGIGFLDEARLGSQENLPDHRKNNAGRNTYFFLPLLLGILGAVYLYKKDQKMFWVVSLLFFFTGLAIVLYLNQPPFQPRERDYAYAGSFYAFTIFIGFGVAAIFDWTKQLLGGTVAATGSSVLSIAAVPLLLVSQNWDDHDRSGRYTARDFAHNYLNSCEKDGIIFTNGDNDTFPLWYAQDVEGIRTDVRVVNLSYLATDWYASQQQRKVYNSPTVPFKMTIDQYRQGTRDIVYIFEKVKGYRDIRKQMEFVGSDDPRTRIQTQSGETIDFFPTKLVNLPIDSAAVVGTVVAEKDADKVVKEMKWELKGQAIRKSELMVLDLLANNNWKRPMYWAITVGPDSYANLQDYFRLDGMAYKLVPVKSANKRGNTGYVDSDVLYDNMMNKFRYGGIDNPNVYLDENNRRMLMNLKNNFVRLAEQLQKEGKNKQVDEVVKRANSLMPNSRVPFNYYNLLMAEPYYKAGFKTEANAIIEQVWNNNMSELMYFLTVGADYVLAVGDEKDRAFAILFEIINMYDRLGENANTRLYAQQGVDLMERLLPYIAPFRSIENEADVYQLYSRLSESAKQDVSLYMRLLEKLDKK